MANQIAGAFGHQDPEKAAAAVYDHIWHFWDRRMRRLIVEHLANGGAGLSEVARAAAEWLAIGEKPVLVTRATEFSGAGDATAASDAG
jgi:formate dehydrogenase subunit delta